jgi:hypothetical protein
VVSARDHSRVARWCIFISKNPNWGIFLRALEWKILVYYYVIGIFYSYLAHFIVIW